MAGVTDPLGFWDPAGISAKVDDSTFLFFREIEIKHGRVAMLASAGIIVTDVFPKYHPFFGGDTPDYTTAIAAHIAPATVETFWPAGLVLIGLHELLLKPVEGSIPGDLGFDPVGFKPKDPQALKNMQNRELNNGRLAMFAAAGLIAQELIYGTL